MSHLGGPKLAAKPEGCALEIFPSTTPPYPWNDVARVETRCHMTVGREGCMKQLRKNACAQGGDTLYDLDEGKQAENHIIIGTVAVRTGDPPVAPPPAPKQEVAPAGCQFDTQCKGERVCSDGECVDPTPAAAPAPAPAP